MPTYIVETTARASIREFWRVTAKSETKAREAVESGDAEFLFDETLGDEEEREVDTVHPGDMLGGQLASRKVEAAAPAMLAALEIAESFMAGFEGDDCQETLDDDLEQVRAAIARARGTPAILAAIDGEG